MKHSALLESIEQAFLQLEFSIKLLNYTELHKIVKKEFDTHTEIILAGGNITYRENSFDTYDDLISGATNNFNITLAFTAITLNKSLEDAGFKRTSQKSDTRNDLATLVYLIRCAYAHDMMRPQWKIRPKNARLLKVRIGTTQLEIDLSNKDKEPFDMKDIGGHKNYFELKNSVCEIIQSV